MNKPTKETVYLPTSDSNVEFQVGRFDNKDYYKSFEKIRDVYEEERFVFTSEQLNKYTANVIKQTLETAAEKGKIKIEETNEIVFKGFSGGNPSYGNREIITIDKQSIVKTFEEIYQKFEI